MRFDHDFVVDTISMCEWRVILRLMRYANIFCKCFVLLWFFFICESDRSDSDLHFCCFFLSKFKIYKSYNLLYVKMFKFFFYIMCDVLQKISHLIVHIISKRISMFIIWNIFIFMWFSLSWMGFYWELNEKESFQKKTKMTDVQAN
jgi:hypothetical protein